MGALEELGYDDVRSEMYVAATRLQGNRAATIGVIWHYNGPPLDEAGNPDAEYGRIVWDSQYHRDKNWGSAAAPAYGDTIMYHWVVLSNGKRLLVRNPFSTAWHAGEQFANLQMVAIHVPIGAGQYMTPIQYQSICQLTDALIADYAMAGKHMAFGHQERSMTECPGSMQAQLVRYRQNLVTVADAPSLAAYWSRKLYDVTGQCNIRRGATTESDDLGDYFIGDVLDVEATVPDGQDVGGSRVWLKCRAKDGKPAGFVHAGNGSLIIRKFALPGTRNVRDAFKTSAPANGRVSGTIPIAEVAVGQKVDGFAVWGRQPEQYGWVWLGNAKEQF